MSELNLKRWRLFLTDKATKSELTGKEMEIFIYQFDLQREHLPNTEIAKSIEAERFISFDNFKERTDSIYKKFQSNIKDEKGTRPDRMWQWLKKEYPQWEDQLLGRSKLGVEALWIQLKELGRYAPERMGLYSAENQLQTASALPKDYQPKPFLKSVTQGTDKLKFKLLSEGVGQVLLLNCDDAKVVYCLCPSEFAPSFNLEQKELSVPQSESDYAYLGAEPGKEEWWAWIVNKLPPLSWLESARSTALQLSAVQLAELLSQVELQKGEVLHTFYKVL
jgi:hypothetical protein